MKKMYANLTTLPSVVCVHLFMQMVLMIASKIVNLVVVMFLLDVVDALGTRNGHTNGNSKVVVKV